LTALVAAGAEDDNRIDSELADDDTAGGARRAATARAAKPTTGAKEQAAALLTTTGEDAPSNPAVRATPAGLVQPRQEYLRTGLEERYPDTGPAWWASRPGDLAQTVAEGLLPRWSVEPETVERFGAEAADTAYPSALRRIIAEQTADLTRALAA